ncbi:MAG TPA: efflux transporter outer membrane subunit [Burkholderiaceae bacterium]|nr:efflux transporter outer membrane subunit [Burkholderiaceae bacterium]
MLRMLKLGALATLLALGGCMSLIPTYERPAAPIPAAYPAAASSAPAGVAVADIEWQRFVADARLARLIEIALANNRDLRIAALRIEQARAQYDIRRADRLPTVNAGLSAQRQAGASGEVGNVFAAGILTTSFELDFFGRVRSLGEVALAQYLATEEARKSAQIALVAAVVNTYVAQLADDELLRVTRETLATREESFKLTKLKFDNGAASGLDAAQAESLLEGARAALAQTQRQRALDANALALLLGQAPPGELPPALPLGASLAITQLPPGLPSELLTRRPDIRAAEQQLIGANANIGAARALFFPRISLTANAGTASAQLSGLFRSGSFALTGGVQLLQPIFDAGRNDANLKVAKVNREIALAQYEVAIQTAFREVADALAGRATLTEQLRAQQAQADAAQTTLHLAELRYRNGAASYLDVLDAQRTLFAAQQATVQVRAAQVQNLVTLYKTLGGGWTPPTATS